MKLCELWDDKTLDEFIEAHTEIKNGLTICPAEEWAEKTWRNILKNIYKNKKYFISNK